MTPTRFLIGQITIVFAIVIGGLWVATQWMAAELAYQPRLGDPWFTALALPVYHPCRLFEWWYAYDAYAPRLFDEAGVIAASGGFLGIVNSAIAAPATTTFTSRSRWQTQAMYSLSSSSSAARRQACIEISWWRAMKACSTGRAGPSITTIS